MPYGIPVSENRPVDGTVIEIVPKRKHGSVRALPVVSRASAVASGASYFFTGVSCKHGHVEERFVLNRQCRECVRVRGRTPEAVARVKRHQASLTHRQKMLQWAKYRQGRDWPEVPFELTEDDIEWPKQCPALGIELRYEAQRSRNADNAPTLDRKNSALGYVRGNVQVLSRKANRIKNDGTPDEVMRVALFMQEGE